MAIDVDEVKGGLRGRPKKDGPKWGLSTGSTLVNLACSGRPYLGFLPGKYYSLVGESQAGKTFLAMTCLAEASVSPHFKDYRLIFDDVEGGALMEVGRYFGPALVKRLEPPSLTKDKKPAYSSTIEEFYYHFDDAARSGKPFVYVLDSMDALSSEDEQKKFAEKKLAHRKGKVVPGSYGDGKAKKNSSNIRGAVNAIKGSGSILIVLGQSRDNVGTFSFEKKTRSGGRALKFYATNEIWFSVKGSIKRSVRGKPRKVGSIFRVQVKKNRQTGREPPVDVHFFPSHGFDDVGSVIDWLVEEKHWPGTKSNVTAKEFGFTGDKELLIAKIEKEGLEKDLVNIASTVWKEIEAQCEVNRKNRYRPE